MYQSFLCLWILKLAVFKMVSTYGVIVVQVSSSVTIQICPSCINYPLLTSKVNIPNLKHLWSVLIKMYTRQFKYNDKIILKKSFTYLSLSFGNQNCETCELQQQLWQFGAAHRWPPFLIGFCSVVSDDISINRKTIKIYSKLGTYAFIYVSL